MGAAADPVSPSGRLSGVRVLVVEDDFFIALELATTLSDAGAEVVGPSNTVESALSSAEDETLSAAILDIRLGSETVAPVARLLAKHHVPFLFYTGQSKTDPLSAEWPDCQVLGKPALAASIIKAVMGLLEKRVSASY
jgi:DNA-binding NtrC family response regulator